MQTGGLLRLHKSKVRFVVKRKKKFAHYDVRGWSWRYRPIDSGAQIFNYRIQILFLNYKYIWQNNTHRQTLTSNCAADRTDIRLVRIFQSQVYNCWRWSGTHGTSAWTSWCRIPSVGRDSVAPECGCSSGMLPIFNAQAHYIRRWVSRSSKNAPTSYWNDL